MKKVRSFVLGLWFAGSLWAFLPPQARASSHIDLTLGYESFDYSESLSAPLKSTENAWLPVIGAKWEQLPKENERAFGGALFVSPGNTVYDGTTQSGTPASGTTSNLHLDLSGYALFRLSQGVLAGHLIYAGLGLHWWKRDLSGISGGYQEDYYWLYIPLGIRGELWKAEALSLNFDFSLRPMVFGWINIRLSQLGDYQDATGLLGAAGGFRLELPLQWQITEAMNLVFKPCVDLNFISKGTNFDIKRKNGSVEGSGYEPASRTFKYGGSVEWQIYF